MPVGELAVGRRLVGLSQVRRELLRERVQKVFLADDVDSRISSEILRLAEERGVPVERVCSKAHLGRACAISRSAAVAAVQRESRC